MLLNSELILTIRVPKGIQSNSSPVSSKMSHTEHPVSGRPLNRAPKPVEVI